jgi:hypothetical protein
VVAEIASAVSGHEAAAGTLRTARRQSGAARQQQAVGAIIGGLLRSWGREEPQSVFRSRTKDDFTGGPVAARQYLAASDALAALGLVGRSQSIRYGTGIVWDAGGPEHFAGKAPRLWPTQALLDAAVVHGVMPTTLEDDFADVVVWGEAAAQWGAPRGRVRGDTNLRTSSTPEGDPLVTNATRRCPLWDAVVRDAVSAALVLGLSPREAAGPCGRRSPSSTCSMRPVGVPKMFSSS